MRVVQSKIYKNKPNKIFERESARPVYWWIRLWLIWLCGQYYWIYSIDEKKILVKRISAKLVGCSLGNNVMMTKRHTKRQHNWSLFSGLHFPTRRVNTDINLNSLCHLHLNLKQWLYCFWSGQFNHCMSQKFDWKLTRSKLNQIQLLFEKPGALLKTWWKTV